MMSCSSIDMKTFSHTTVKSDRSRSKWVLNWTEAVSGLYDGSTSAVWILDPARTAVSAVLSPTSVEVSFCLSHQHDDSRQPEGELVQRQSWRGTSLIDEYQLDQTWHSTERPDLMINTSRWSDPDSTEDQITRTNEPLRNHWGWNIIYNGVEM